jgi:hypothetical protein
MEPEGPSQYTEHPANRVYSELAKFKPYFHIRFLKNYFPLWDFYRRVQ